MGSIANRIGRLEGDHAPPCPKCGHDGDPSKLRFEVSWADEEPGEPEWCGECGRALEIVVTWGDGAGTMSMGRRLERLESLKARAVETRAELKERRKRIRDQAEHANLCHRSEVLPFVIDEDGNVFASRDGKPITDTRQTLAEEWYWQEVDEGGEGLVHDEEAEAFYARSGELAISRDRVDLQHFMGDARWEHL